MGRVALLLVGGSHLASPGLSPTANFGVLVGRRLRRALGPSFAGTSWFFHEGAPAAIPGLLPDPMPEGAVVFVLPRNLALTPLLGELRLAAARLRRGGRPVAFTSAFEPRRGWAEMARRVRLALRRMASLAYAIVWLPFMPARVARYGRELDRVLAVVRERARGGLIVLATPVPLNDREFPLARHYQRRYARLIRRRRGEGVEVADVFAALAAAPDGFVQPRDPLHLTAEGHRRVADALWAAIAAGLAMPAPVEA